MVSAAALGSTLEQGCQIGSSSVDFRANFGQNVSSAFYARRENVDDSVQKTTREAIKRKLTARVLPMTRNAEDSVDTRATQFQNGAHRDTRRPHDQQFHKACISNVKPGITDRNCKANPSNDQQRLTEKKNVATTNIVAAASSSAFCEIQDEPAPKRQRTILPRTTIQLQGQIRPEVIQRQPTSPEPKLMGDNMGTMSLLAASECHLANLQDEDGDTPLHIAIAHGNTQLTEYLIDLVSCLTVDTYNNLKQTPLHLAVITQQALVVRKLVAAGANVNLPDRNGQTPAHLACQRSDIVCLEELHQAANKVDLNLQNFNGFSPLHEAVFASSNETVLWLINHGAFVNCKDGKSGRTPLHHAVEAENVPVIQQLLKCRADVSVTAFSGSTALHTASGRGMQNIRLLLETGTTNGTKAAMAIKPKDKTSNLNQAPVNKIRRSTVVVKDIFI